MVDEPAGHTPVLTREVCELLAVRAGETVLDATVGVGGHARLFAEALGPEGTFIGLDVDPANLAVARRTLSEVACRVELVHANFEELGPVLESVGVAQVDVLFADLGVSSTQLDDAARGFSFQRDGALDMRMDPRLTTTAADLINRLKEQALGDLFYHNAQERAARRIAKRVCEARREKRITTTGQLARIISNALGVDPSSRRTKIHPATRTFLALRIAVNDEIGCLQALLAAAPEMLRPGGRIGVIAFHSVEDKPVKTDFRGRKREGVYRIVTQRPVVAEAEERRANPRSRSAKLRVAIRLPE
ncbi:MAG: 16S rRNA (cytosine(1402)-N(4))-methyltransferase RsmH [Phycisphaerales bacterium]|nr:MAG: 16S rRNA (cytosine(1402)-N(4))-methyltransferase RsmH [Phycisphaerales bacterium]